MRHVFSSSFFLFVFSSSSSLLGNLLRYIVLRRAPRGKLRCARVGEEGREGEFFLRFAARGTMEIMLKNER